MRVFLLVFVLMVMVAAAEDFEYSSYDYDLGSETDLSTISPSELNIPEITDPATLGSLTVDQISYNIEQFNSEQFGMLSQDVIADLSQEDCLSYLDSMTTFQTLNSNELVAFQIAYPDVKLSNEEGYFPDKVTLERTESDFKLKTPFGDVNFDPESGAKISYTSDGLLLDDKYLLVEGNVRLKPLDPSEDETYRATTEYIFGPGSVYAMKDNIAVRTDKEMSFISPDGIIQPNFVWGETNKVYYTEDGEILYAVGDKLSFDLVKSPQILYVDSAYGEVTVNGPARADGTYTSCAFSFGQVSCQGGSIQDLGVRNIFGTSGYDADGKPISINYYEFRSANNEPCENCEPIPCQAQVCAYGDSSPTALVIKVTGMASEEGWFDSACSTVANILRFGAAPPKAEAVSKTTQPVTPPKTDTQPKTEDTLKKDIKVGATDLKDTKKAVEAGPSKTGQYQKDPFARYKID